MRAFGKWRLISLLILIFQIFELKSELYPDNINPDNDNNYIGNMMQHLEITSIATSAANKRACIPRGGNCDHRPNECCYNSSCRCNLWGSNCRCQRMGLFQKWG